MANVQRLTKRVSELETWVKENEMTGGPQGTLDTFNFLINEARNSSQVAQNSQQQFQQLRAAMFEFLKEQKLEVEWDEFLKEKENAVQKQPTEEVPLQEEAESGEEAVEAPEEESSETKD